MSPTHQYLSNDTTFSQIKSRPVPLKGNNKKCNHTVMQKNFDYSNSQFFFHFPGLPLFHYFYYLFITETIARFVTE